MTDIYSTDAKIAELGLAVLDDDQQYFPRYDAVLLYRLDLPQRLPAAWAALQQLEGRIDEERDDRDEWRAELRGGAFADDCARLPGARAAGPRRRRAAAAGPSCSRPTWRG